MTLEEISENHPEILKADGFDDCIVGVGYQFGQPAIIYSREKVIQKLMEMDKMDRETAEEHFDFNIGGAFVGEFTPIFMEELTEE